MNKKDIYTLICNVFGVEAEDITDESDIYDDLNADATALIELQLQLEDLLKTKFDKDDFSQLETVQDLFDLIENNTDEYLD